MLVWKIFDGEPYSEYPYNLLNNEGLTFKNHSVLRNPNKN